MSERRIKKDAFGHWSTRSLFAKPVNMPDIGSVVKAEMYEIEMKAPGLAKRLNIPPARVYRMLRRKDWRVSEIMNVSTVLALNLFDWYARQTQPKETQPAQPVAVVNKDAELNILRQKTAVLEAENKLLREMVDALKAK